MDEYGSMRNNKEDWDTIYIHLVDHENVSFSYSADNYTAFVITITGPLTQLGTMAFGGKVTGNFCVAIRARGSNYFKLNSDRELSPDYIEEKLSLTNESDAIVIAELLNEIRNRFSNTVT